MDQRQTLREFFNKNKGQEHKILEQAIKKGYDKNIAFDEYKQAISNPEPLTLLKQKSHLWIYLTLAIIILIIIGGGFSYWLISHKPVVGSSPPFPTPNDIKVTKIIRDVEPITKIIKDVEPMKCPYDFVGKLEDGTICPV